MTLTYCTIDSRVSCFPLIESEREGETNFILSSLLDGSGKERKAFVFCFQSHARDSISHFVGLLVGQLVGRAACPTFFAFFFFSFFFFFFFFFFFSVFFFFIVVITFFVFFFFFFFFCFLFLSSASLASSTVAFLGQRARSAYHPPPH